MRKALVVLLVAVMVFGLSAVALAAAPTLEKVSPAGASFSVVGDVAVVSVRPTFTGGTTSLSYTVGAGSPVEAYATTVSGSTYAVSIAGLAVGANTVTITATNVDGATTTGTAVYTVTASAPVTGALGVSFSMDQMWPTANDLVGRFLPVLYVVVGLTVGGWILFKIRGLF